MVEAATTSVLTVEINQALVDQVLGQLRDQIQPENAELEVFNGQVVSYSIHSALKQHFGDEAEVFYPFAVDPWSSDLRLAIVRLPRTETALEVTIPQVAVDRYRSVRESYKEGTEPIAPFSFVLHVPN